MNDFKVFFNGVDLSEYLKVTDLQRNISTERSNKLMQVGTSHFKKYRGYILSEKIIEMSFVLKYDLVKKRRALAKILNVSEPVELYFSDENDKYYLAVPSGEIKILEKNFLGRGNITWIIPDGIAHSFKEKTISNDFSDLIKIENEGSYKTSARINVKMSSDNGFLGFINQDGALLQFGNPDEIDGATYEQSEFGIIDYCGENFDQKNYESNGWKTNQGHILQTFGTCAQTGNIAYGKYMIDYDIWKGQVIPNFHPSSYGSGNEWHGPSMTRAFTPDSSGSDTADNFKFDITQYFITGLAHQIGMQQWLVNAPDGENVAGYAFIKNKSVNQVTIHFIINGKSVYNFETYAGIDGRWSGWSWGKWRIEKFENLFTFTTPDGVWNFTDSIAGKLKAKYTTFYAAQYADKPAVTIQFMRRIQFVKHNVKKWVNIPNKFGKFDRVSIDTYDGKVLLNGVETPSLGALGNEWERFFLKEGTNTIQCLYSDFADKPEISISYNEVFL